MYQLIIYGIFRYKNKDLFIENLNSLDFPWLKYGDDIEIGDIGNFIKHQV
jgi:hypothetical protein